MIEVRRIISTTTGRAFAGPVTDGKGSAAEGAEAKGNLVIGNKISLTVAIAECYHDSLLPCGCVGSGELW